MLNIAHYKRNANQNHNKVLSHTGQNSHYQKVYNACWKGCGEKETFLPCWWECNLTQSLWRTVWRVFKKTNEPPTNKNKWTK